MKELKFSANLLECTVKHTGDYPSDGKTKLYALYDKMTKKRVTPAYTLDEWKGKNEAKEILRYLNDKSE